MSLQLTAQRTKYTIKRRISLFKIRVISDNVAPMVLDFIYRYRRYLHSKLPTTDTLKGT